MLVLASSSPFRRELLARLGLPFDAASPDVDESPLPGEAPDALAARLAEAKARALRGRFPGARFIGSDQVAVARGRVLGKPGNAAAAAAQLRWQSGGRTDFYTGLCLYDDATGVAQTVVEPFSVTFRTLTDAHIARYVAADEPFGCAASFRSEARGITLFTAMEGRDPNALVGLPLIALVDLLAAAGVELP
jgi:MAF protein